jgi:hypothetical protein
MNQIISWLDVGDVSDLAPSEWLKHYTEIIRLNLSVDPWVAVTRSIVSDSERFHSVGISLRAEFEFVSDVIQAFGNLAQVVIAKYTLKEVESIKAYERSQGNPDRIWDADEAYLGIFVPERLLLELKSGVESLFADAAVLVREIPIEQH